MSSYIDGGFGSRYNYDWTGKLIANNYILIKKLGYGSYAVVWLCYSLKHKKCYAIKILNPEDHKSGRKEIDMFNLINKKSQYIISMIDHFEIPVPNDQLDDGDEYFDDSYSHVCIILELMLCSVYDIIKICHKTNKYLPLKFIKKVIFETLLATSTLHKNGIIHTDIKPENMLISFDHVTEISKFISEFIDNNNLIRICNYFNNNNINNMLLKTISNLRRKYKNQHLNIKEIAIKELVIRILRSLDNNENYTEKIDKKNSRDNKKNYKNDSDSESIDYTIQRYEITDSESELDESNDEPNDKPDNKSVLEYKYFKNISIKISDLGTCIKKENLNRKQIQTRHYRAPEVILGLRYNEKCDIWSIGCCIYELLTLELLFNPNETDTISCDRFHICEFINKLGLIPQKMINESPKKDVYFKRNGYIRGVDNLSIDLVWSTIEEIKLNIYNKDRDINLLSDLMSKMLKFDPEKRISTNNSLEHNCFKENLNKKYKI